MKYEIINRKDGITYKRKKLFECNDCNINIRYKKSKVEQLKKIADKKQLKYQAMIKDILEDFIEQNNYGE